MTRRLDDLMIHVSALSQPDLRQDAQIAPAPPKSAPSQLCHRTLSAEFSHTETRHVKACQQLAVSDFGHFFLVQKIDTTVPYSFSVWSPGSRLRPGACFQRSLFKLGGNCGSFQSTQTRGSQPEPTHRRSK